MPKIFAIDKPYQMKSFFTKTFNSVPAEKLAAGTELKGFFRKDFIGSCYKKQSDSESDQKMCR